MPNPDRSHRLGRGLAALLGDVALPDPATLHTVRLLPVEALQSGPFQPRRMGADEALAGLAESIRSSGILQPVLVRASPTEPDIYQIIAGERRWRAAQLAGLHEVPCLIRRVSDADAMATGLVENLQRQDLNAIEEAEGYRRLAGEFDLGQEEIARLVGKSRSHVANTQRLLALPMSVQGEVRTGQLSAGHARALLSHADPARAALAVIARGLNVRQTEALAQAHLKGTTEPIQSDSATRSLEQELASHLGLRVTLAQRGTRGSVRIDYTDLDQLDGIISLLLQRQTP